MAQSLFRAIFVEQIVLEEAMLADIATEAGLDKRQFTEACADPRTSTHRATLVDQAIGRGVFGVPTFHLGDRIFWGNDRLILLEHALTKNGVG